MKLEIHYKNNIPHAYCTHATNLVPVKLKRNGEINYSVCPCDSLTKNPIHPGEHLREFLEESYISIEHFARLAMLSPTTVRDILKEKRNITEHSANGIAHALYQTPNYWLNLQKIYDRHKTQWIYSHMLDVRIAEWPPNEYQLIICDRYLKDNELKYDVLLEGTYASIDVLQADLKVHIAQYDANRRRDARISHNRN